MTVEELAKVCADAVSDELWPRRDEATGLALVRLTVSRRSDPGANKRVRLFGRSGPMSYGPLAYVGHDRYIGEWSAMSVLAYLTAKGLIEVDIKDAKS